MEPLRLRLTYSITIPCGWKAPLPIPTPLYTKTDRLQTFRLWSADCQTGMLLFQDRNFSLTVREQTDRTENIISATNMGGKNKYWTR